MKLPSGKEVVKVLNLASSVLLVTALSSPAALGQTNTNPIHTGRIVAPDNDPVSTCMAAQSLQPKPEKRKNGPIRIVSKSIASELGTDSSNMMKDAIFVFSAKDVDPYDKAPPTDKPYTLLEATMVDGSQASLIKYPDNSGKIVGGFADGTIIVPVDKGTFIVAYPNGVRGKLVKVSDVEYKIYRPDNSITTIKKTMSGGYDITNDKIGYMGTARPDTLGMQFEFNTTNF